VAKTATSLKASQRKVALGGSATFSASVAATPLAGQGGETPTGTVAFLAGSTLLGTGLVGADGIARFSTTSLPQGPLSLSATYAGDGRHDPSTSPPIDLDVLKPWLPAQGFGASTGLAPLAALSAEGQVQAWGSTTHPATMTSGRGPPHATRCGPCACPILR
jgi:hypothetical protein